MTTLSKGIILGALIITAITLPVLLYFKSLQPDYTAYELINYRTVYIEIVRSELRPQSTVVSSPKTPIKRTTSPTTPPRTAQIIPPPTTTQPRTTVTTEPRMTSQQRADALDREQYRANCIALSNFLDLPYSDIMDGNWSGCVARMKDKIMREVNNGGLLGTNYTEAMAMLKLYAN